MIVDDEPDLAHVLRHLLSTEFEVVLAMNGLEALERLDRYEPDFIVMDVMMPVLDGFDTTRAIKKNARFADVPVLFLSARTDNLSVREGLMTGGEMYLEKPFVPDDFLNRINEIIQKYHVQPVPKQFTLQEIERHFSADAAPPTIDRIRRNVPSDATNTPPPAAPPRVRLLVVDDDKELVDQIKATLREDYEVIGTTDSESAPDRIMAYQPDILLLDVVMPKLNGLHLSHLMRLNRRLRGARIIFMSLPTDRHAMDNNLKLPAADFLEKPFTPDQLRRRIAEVTKRPDFQRTRKRVSYTEILRREGEIT
jgi:DNA-binding response OmpR family regulator